ncbi:TolC family outer membrane protein [Gimibacter soli]|uniref:TolC family outer membrane protein n=1 Tax=Gimibacter soli TaxID=3024400 RepID=A0AAF0BL78_9PROT|nr:TolC family outer membrane protein [Gimibacter soli]WCL53145.1 TolC family outer membrane protein [Gimibacter soli]
MKKTIASLLAIATVLGGTGAVSAETLKEALEAAYASNPTLQAQRAAVRAIDNTVPGAKAAFLPSVVGEASYGERHGKVINSQAPNGPRNDADVDSTAYGVTAQLSIFNGMRDLNAVRQAKAEVMVARAQLQNTEQQVLLQGIAAYMDVVRDQSVVELNKNQVQVLERQLEASRDRFRVGEITRTDVAQSEARLEGAKSQLLAAEAQLAASRGAYQRVIGRAPAGLDTPGGLPVLPASLESAIETAMADAPNVIAARYSEEAARRGIHIAEGGLLPRLGAEASYSHTDGSSLVGNNTTPDDSDIKAFGFQLTVPLYTGGATYADIRRAKEVRSQRMVQIVEAERSAQETALVTWDRLRAARGQIASTEAQVRANEIALEGVRQEAAVGSRTTLDVLNAEQELLDARANLIRAQRDEFVAAYNLLAAVGTLNSGTLGLDVDAYDPEEHYDDVKNQMIGW